jgi:hypothetical protein
VVEAAGDNAGVQPGERVYASLFPAGGGFAELALASADRAASMPGWAGFAEAAGLVIAGGTALRGPSRAGAAADRRDRAHHRRRGRRGQRRGADRATAGGRALGVASATTATCGAWMPARCSTITPPTGHSRCATQFPAASTCCWTVLAARPATRPSARSGTAAGRSSSLFKVLRPAGARHHRRALRRPRHPAAARGAEPPSRRGRTSPPGVGASATGSGPRGAGAGRGPARSRQDRAANRAVAAALSTSRCRRPDSRSLGNEQSSYRRCSQAEYAIRPICSASPFAISPGGCIQIRLIRRLGPTAGDRSCRDADVVPVAAAPAADVT